MKLPLDDRGLLLGDGLFETILVVDGVAHALPAHLARMASGCASLGLPPLDETAACAAITQAVGRGGSGRLAVRLTLTAGSGGRGLDRPGDLTVRLFATSAPTAPPLEPARLMLASTRRNEGSPASRLKTLSYIDGVIARREARAAGADEALMLNNRGEIASAAAANIFWIAGERLFTPALECGVLAGTMRARVIAAGQALGVLVGEVRETPAVLAGADAAFLTNALVGIREVSAFMDRKFEGSALVGKLAGAVAAN